MQKLVRDKIPNIIESQGQKSNTTIVENDLEYYNFLKTKLNEEVLEFQQSTDSINEKEELADILEVIDAICDFKKIDKEELQKIKLKKLNERGGFKNRIVLIKD